ncbi:MAG: hypothetical protein AAF962_19035 [Actinomycetota bacterium]
MRSPRLAAQLLAVALVAVACGEVVEPEGFAVSTSILAVDGDDAGASSVGAPASDNDDPTSLVSPNFLPQRSLDYTPELLISTDEEILLAGPGGAASGLTGTYAGLPSARAVDDLLGGLVYQQAGVDGDVLWLTSEDATVQVLAEGVELLDVGFSRAAFAVVQSGQELEQIRLADAERQPFITLAEGEEILNLSVSGGLHAMAIANEECGDLRFFDVEGTEIGVQGPGEPNCPVPRRPYFATVALSPDGAALAYTIVTYRDDGLEAGTELVVRDLANGRAYFRRKIGEDGDRITQLTFDGDRVAYLKSTADSAQITVLEAITTGQEQTIDLGATTTEINAVSFARLPLAEG